MALLNFIGAETGDNSELLAMSGTASVQSSVKRSGDYAFQCNPVTTATGLFDVRRMDTDGSALNFAHATLYLTCYFRYATKPGSNDEPIIAFQTAANAQKLEVRINSSGQLVAYNAAGTLLSTGSTVLAQDTWYRVEVSCASSATVGAWEVKIDGASEISGTANTSATNHARILLGKSTNRNGNTVDFFFDDIAVKDNAFIGAGQVNRMDPDSAGTDATGWTGGTGSTFAEVDDAAVNDGDTTYWKTSTANDVRTVGLETSANAGVLDTPVAVKSISFCRDEVGTSGHQLRLRSGGTTDDTVALNISNSYALRAKVYETDPADAGAWTVADLDALEVGVKSSVSVAIRCTALAVMVWSSGNPQSSGGQPFDLRVESSVPKFGGVVNALAR